MEIFNKLKNKKSYSSFGTGKVISLEKVNDPVFSSKMMGDGYAIEIEDGKIYSPIDGELSVVFPTGHAYGISATSGLDILIHVGIDTVSLQGEGFDIKVKQGDKVRKGDLLVDVDLDLIKSRGLQVTTPFIITSGEQVQLLKENEIVTPNDIDLFRLV